jgi:CheY-like chemotaxis protein
VTGYGQAADRRRSKEAGFDAHLVKPVSQSLLSSLIAASS